MSTVTAIRNPKDESQALLFYLNAENLIEFRAIPDKPLDDHHKGPQTDLPGGDEPVPPAQKRQPAPKPAPPPKPQPPPQVDPTDPVIMNPNAITSLVLNNLICVYGIRSDKVIAMLSPGHQKLDQLPTAEPFLAGCSDGGEIGWLYYGAPSEDDAEKIVLKQIILPTGPTDFVTEEGTTVPEVELASGSKLAACYNPHNQHHYCFFQSPTDVKLRYVETDQNGNTQVRVMPASVNTKPQTPLAVCVNTHREKIYLYYEAAEKNIIMRREMGFNGQTWSEGVPVLGEPKAINADYQVLAATAHSGGSRNILYYVRQKPKGFKGKMTFEETYDKVV